SATWRSASARRRRCSSIRPRSRRRSAARARSTRSSPRAASGRPREVRCERRASRRTPIGRTLLLVNRHEADVAYVLSSVAGVRAVYRIAPERPAAAHFDFAVEIEPSERSIAEAQYALLRVMDHEGCARVCFGKPRLFPAVAEAARLIELGAR